ncbi:Fic family protein [Cellulomonas sp. HZM]|uniref:Fic family protein n=1 Tax=Cellulomonas sp. HZM TaxID=1454010 RepID=UPI0004937AE5|nr:Fic family protein [Cellulomonas sp. HZM]
MFAYPSLDDEDTAVLASVSQLRDALADRLRPARRWAGSLRRTSFARNIQGSNSIEGIDVRLDDAVAAIDDEPPLSADEQTFAEIRGYRQALEFALAIARDPHGRVDESALRAMHFMIQSHDLTKSPGQYRPADIHVVDGDGTTVYTGPDAADVPRLMSELVDHLDELRTVDPMVRGAMAHLDLVMVHPFRDGNGRMARALQTLVLAQSGVPYPEFVSIEEWLGANTQDYYRALAHTGHGRWNPAADAHLWVKFTLRAHHMQAQTVARRVERMDLLYATLAGELATLGLPERTLDALYTASIGFRLRRPTYVSSTGVDDRTATRDLSALTAARLLRAVGETKGRHYVAGTRLEEIVTTMGARTPLTDPYPWLPSRLAQPVG